MPDLTTYSVVPRPFNRKWRYFSLDTQSLQRLEWHQAPVRHSIGVHKAIRSGLRSYYSLTNGAPATGSREQQSGRRINGLCCQRCAYRMPSAPMTRSVSCVVPSEKWSTERVDSLEFTEIHLLRKWEVVSDGLSNPISASKKDALCPCI